MGICAAALVAWWWSGRQTSPADNSELHRLRRAADAAHREGFQPFD